MQKRNNPNSWLKIWYVDAYLNYNARGGTVGIQVNATFRVFVLVYGMCIPAKVPVRTQRMCAGNERTDVLRKYLGTYPCCSTVTNRTWLL